MNDAIQLVDFVATAVFAISGALAAAEQKLDVLGFILFGTITGIGGGTVRDLLLGTDVVFWFSCCVPARSSSISGFPSTAIEMGARKPASSIDPQCPCGGGKSYSECCEVFISGDDVAPTAEQLMRSRYSAFAMAEPDYLLASWHPDTRPSRVRLNEEQKWIGLSIKSTEAGQADDSHGRVEFVARFKVAGKGHRLHENSRFEKIDGRWYYLDGEHL